MARDVDRVIDYIDGLDYIPPVMRRVMVNRLDPPPTRDEIDRAAADIFYGVQADVPAKPGV